jgi:hypothetical protein
MSLADADQPPNLPALIDRARFRLETARTSAEALEARTMAEAARHFAKLLRASNEVQADCLRLIDRAEKLIGTELIAAKESGEVAKVGQPRVSSTASRIHDLGISYDESAYFQRRARTPDSVIDRAIQKALEEDRAPLKKDLRAAVKGATGIKITTRKGKSKEGDLIKRLSLNELGGWVLAATRDFWEGIPFDHEIVPEDDPVLVAERDDQQSWVMGAIMVAKNEQTGAITITIPSSMIKMMHLDPRETEVEFRLTKFRSEALK